jgi:hypothetical protein
MICQIDYFKIGYFWRCEMRGFYGKIEIFIAAFIIDFQV